MSATAAVRNSLNSTNLSNTLTGRLASLLHDLLIQNINTLRLNLRNQNESRHRTKTLTIISSLNVSINIDANRTGAQALNNAQSLTTGAALAALRTFRLHLVLIRAWAPGGISLTDA